MHISTLLYRSFLGALASTAFLVTGTVQAQGVVVPNNDWVILTGSFLVFESPLGVGDTCDVDGWGTSDASTETGTVEDLETSGTFICDIIVTFRGLSYDMDYDATATPPMVTIHDVWIDTGVGECRGDITSGWQPDPGATPMAGTGTMVFDERLLGDCVLSGEIFINWPRP